MRIRSAAVAGTFYPQTAQQLSTEVAQLLSRTKTHTEIPASKLRALVVPHAGYMYSGAIAASAYNLLKDIKHRIVRVVLLGPSHRVPLRGIALPDCEVFETPLGSINLDDETLQDLKVFSSVSVAPEAHTWEHSLEVQLPFLQSVLNEFVLVPLVVGQVSDSEVVQVLESFWPDNRTLIVISSDLSHYLPYQQAQQRDNDTSHLIESRYHQLHGEQACGCYPLNGLLKLAEDHDLQVKTLAQCNSGDTAGSQDRVVGYGAYAVYHRTGASTF